MDTHAHMATTEVHLLLFCWFYCSLCLYKVLGLLGGSYDHTAHHLHVAIAIPCDSISSTVQCEMDPQSELVARDILAKCGLGVVGWYHSHPTFAPCPSIRGIISIASFTFFLWWSIYIETQVLYQKVCAFPFVGIIVSPYDQRHPSDVSLFNYIVVSDEWSQNHEYQVTIYNPQL